MAINLFVTRTIPMKRILKILYLLTKDKRRKLFKAKYVIITHGTVPYAIMQFTVQELTHPMRCTVYNSTVHILVSSCRLVSPIPRRQTW
jgi:hypothetical protein